MPAGLLLVQSRTWWRTGRTSFGSLRATIRAMRARRRWRRGRSGCKRTTATRRPASSAIAVRAPLRCGRATHAHLACAEVPSQPSAPDVVAVVDDCVTLTWQPAKSAIPVQGYQVEFRDCYAAAAADWLAVNAILSHSCKMTSERTSELLSLNPPSWSVGDLMPRRQYEFRVVAKNAIGYSKPSEPTAPVFINEVGFDAAPCHQPCRPSGHESELVCAGATDGATFGPLRSVGDEDAQCLRLGAQQGSQ